MPEFRVSYEIDLDAEGPREAAERAWEMMRDPESFPPMLSVYRLAELPAGLAYLLAEIQTARDNVLGAELIDLAEGDTGQ